MIATERSMAVAALVVAGSLIGAGCGIRPKRHNDWLIVKKNRISLTENWAFRLG